MAAISYNSNICGHSGASGFSDAHRAPTAKWKFDDSKLVTTRGDNPFIMTRTTEKTRINTSGYLETVASGDPAYTALAGGGAIQGIRLEAARTNLLTYSRDMSAGWGLTRLTASDDSSVAHIDGGDARKFTVSGVGGTCRAENLNVTVTSAAYYVLSIWVKYGSLTANASRLRFDQTTDGDINITWTAGVPSIGSSSNVNTSGVEAHIDDWYRIWLNVTADTTTVNAIFYPDYGTTTTNDYMYFGNAQLEEVPYAGSKPSSYIPTEGIAVVRNLDRCGNTTTFSLEGYATGEIIYIELLDNDADYTSSGADHWYMSLRNGTSGIHHSFNIKSTDKQALWYWSPQPSASQAIIVSLNTSQVGVMRKYAHRNENLNKAGYFNGELEGTNTSRTTIDITYNQAWIGASVVAQNCEDVLVKEARYYQKVLSNAKMAALTTS